MLAIILAAAMGQDFVIPAQDTRDLTSSTRPFVEIERFKDLKCVTANEYRTKDAKTKEIYLTRVYRFTYRADYWQEVKKWQRDFSREKGWTVETTADKGLIVSRKVANPQVKDQALILHSGQIEFDPSAKAHTKVVRVQPGWVWVSFDEHLTTTHW